MFSTNIRRLSAVSSCRSFCLKTPFVGGEAVSNSKNEKPKKPPRVIRMLTEYGAAALQPLRQGKRYIGPLVSRRIAAQARKRALIDGTFGKFEPNKGGWDPSWDPVRKFFSLRPYKGHKRDRTREARADKITAAMKTMPERLTKYKQEMVDRRPKKDLMSLYKRVMERGQKRR